MPFRATADRRAGSSHRQRLYPARRSRDKMASYKASRSVVFVDSPPRSKSNKINWRLLQDAEWKR
jgi:acyl-CoA synthetase (AMP-forming)/AMP-acid ligase II